MTQPAERSGRIVLTHEHVRSFPGGLRIWAIETLQMFNVNTLCQLVACVAKLFVEAADSIADTVCELNDLNEASHYEKVPPVLPAELALVDMSSLVRTWETGRVRLKYMCSDAAIL